MSFRTQLAALIKPLIYVTKDDFRNLTKVKDLGKTLAAGLQQYPQLSTLLPVAQALDQAEMPHKKQLVWSLKNTLEAMLNGTSDVETKKSASQTHVPTQCENKESFFDLRHWLQTPVSKLKGVGPVLTEALHDKGLFNVQDLLYYLPREYDDQRHCVPIAELKPGQRAAVYAMVRSSVPAQKHQKKAVYSLIVSDDKSTLALKWFNQVGRYITEKFKPGMYVRLVGELSLFQGQRHMLHPEIVEVGPPGEFSEEAFKQVLPIYSESSLLSSQKIRALVKQCLEPLVAHQASAAHTIDALNDIQVFLHALDLGTMARECGFDYSLVNALVYLHQPNQEVDIEALRSGRSLAHNRLIFEELLILQLGLLLQKSKLKQEQGPRVDFAETPTQAHFFEHSIRMLEQTLLPFTLTNAQVRALIDIFADYQQQRPMHRLLQGDVGSGKTAVAFLAAWPIIRAGYQVILMAPTEILAEQHARQAERIFSPHGVRTALLTASCKESAAKLIRDALSEHQVDLVIGTHALIEDRVRIKALGLVIIDEQHRFGVMQRARIKEKTHSTYSPHFLVMSATPIPRSLALTAYGDLDVSVINELPPGRTPVKTKLLRERDRRALEAYMQATLERHEQIYVVYPLIEESEKIALKDATSMHQVLQARFSGYRVALLHGQMKPSEKEAIMHAFKAGEVHILVSTTVIEVGVDVPLATLMVVEHAERFGLSQLHQLRGRVGRGSKASACFLMADHLNQIAFQRLMVLCKYHDGFKIAEEDLAIRGPGDFIGMRQSGLPALGLANLVRDQDLLNLAKKVAENILNENNTLEMYPLLNEMVCRRFVRSEKIVHAG